MAMTAETVAWQIHDAEIAGVDFEPEGVNGSIFLNLVPALPDVAVTVTELGGDFIQWCGEGVSEFQIRVRGLEGDQDSASSVARAIVVHLRTDGYGPVRTWAEGETAECRVVYATPSMPYLIGWDETGRPEFGVRLTVRHAA